MKPCLALVLVLAVAGAVRVRRQTHHLGAPQQFSQSQLSRPAPQLTYQFLPQGYGQDASPAPPHLVTARPQQILATARPSPQPSPTPRTRTPTFLPTPRPVLQSQQQASSARRPSSGGQQQGGARGRLSVTREELADELPEDDEELEKPDRLTELLPLSKFDCSGRGTGYYADEGLQCEVFHYCQSGARHSWICPEGFTFHQVHLICMPPGGDNICKKSSQFHFVNEYLYRPINAEEAQSKPNVTLRYADRYYPESYGHYDDEEDRQPLVFAPPQRLPAPPQGKRPTQVLRSQQQQQQPLVRLVAQQQPYQSRNNQVFHSPEEVNIPLQHRRPVVQQRSQDSYEDDEYDDRSTYRRG